VNIGFVSEALPYLPAREGFRIYGANLIRTLSRRHRIHLVSLLTEGDTEHLDWSRPHCTSITTIRIAKRSKLAAPLSALCAHVWGRPLQQRRGVQRAVRAAASALDVLHVEGGYAGGLVPDVRIPTVLSLHDSLTLRCSEMRKCTRNRREKLYYTLLSYHEPRYERLVYPRFDRCTVVAEPDADAIRKTVRNCRIAVIPNGTDTDYFRPVDVQKQPTTLVFHGHLGYAPNIEAALELADSVVPLVRESVPTVTLHLIGASPDPTVAALAARPGITVSANVPDVRPAVCSGQVYVCPIRHGTGLKNKTLEAMAMGLPIVGSPEAVVGLNGVSGTHYLLARRPVEFAARIVELLRHPERGEKMAGAGRRLVERDYSWESRAQAYEDLYQRVIDERLTGRQPVAPSAVDSCHI
jgi:glycosyltransferase involved in cell wall biosynthesis